jgi:hypothetical protein
MQDCQIEHKNESEGLAFNVFQACLAKVSESNRGTSKAMAYSGDVKKKKKNKKKQNKEEKNIRFLSKTINRLCVGFLSNLNF